MYDKRQYFKDATLAELQEIHDILGDQKLTPQDLDIIEKWVDGELGFAPEDYSTGTQWLISRLRKWANR